MRRFDYSHTLSRLWPRDFRRTIYIGLAEHCGPRSALSSFYYSHAATYATCPSLYISHQSWSQEICNLLSSFSFSPRHLTRLFMVVRRLLRRLWQLPQAQPLLSHQGPSPVSHWAEDVQFRPGNLICRGCCAALSPLIVLHAPLRARVRIAFLEWVNYLTCRLLLWAKLSCL